SWSARTRASAKGAARSRSSSSPTTRQRSLRRRPGSRPRSTKSPGSPPKRGTPGMSVPPMVRLVALGARLRKYLIPLAIVGATVAGFVVVARQTAGGAVSAATSPNWFLLALAFGVGAVVQPLRALAWRQTLGGKVGFRAIYVSSAIGSFLDTI